MKKLLWHYVILLGYLFVGCKNDYPKDNGMILQSEEIIFDTIIISSQIKEEETIVNVKENDRKQSFASEKRKGITFAGIQKYLIPRVQYYSWNPERDTLITCSKGTIVYLSRGCLDLPDSKSSVKIEISEYYKLSDFISAGLSTISNKGILETGGMIHIEVFQEGKKVNLKKWRQYALYFPKQENETNADMQTFYGVRNDNDIVTWKLTDRENVTESGGDSRIVNQQAVPGFPSVTLAKDRKVIELKYAEFKDKAIARIDNADLNYYVLTASQFGWINCDRFWNTNDDKVDFVVSADGNNNMNININLIFTDIKSVMPAVKIDGKYVFRNVPVNREVKLVGISNAGDQPSLSVSYTTITKEEFKLKGFKKFSLSDLEKELNSI